VAPEPVKSKKPFSDGHIVKRCIIEKSKAFVDNSIAAKFV
jgi:hypothetical protein